MRLSFVALALTALGYASPLAAEDIPALWDLLAGESTIPGHADGDATTALFSSPHGIDVDAAGNIYVADSGNYVVRRITPAGQVSTFAGQVGRGGLVNGPATTARFGTLHGLTVAADGNIYVAEYNQLRRIALDGTVSTFAGGGSAYSLPEGESRPALSIAVYGAGAIATNAENTVYASTGLGLLKITAQGVATRLSGIKNHFDISDLDFDPAGNLLITHNFGGSITKVSPSGEVMEIGPFYSHPFEERYFSGLAILPNGETWLAQELIGGISRLTTENEIESIARFDPIAGSPVSFTSAWDVAPAPMGGVYLTDVRSHSIQHVALDGTVTVVAGQGAKIGFDGDLAESVFGQPNKIEITPDGTLYVIDYIRIRKIDLTAGTVTTVANSEDSPFPAETAGNWQSFIVTPTGDFYFANYPRNCLSRLTVDGTWSIIAGVHGEAEIRDGTGTEARFSLPRSLSQDASGNLYVADSDTGQTIRRITPDGVVTTIAGSPTEIVDSDLGNGDGVGLAARFRYINSIRVTPTGAIWIGETGLLRYRTPDGTVSTLAGNPTSQFPGGPDGQGADVIFNDIREIVLIDENSVLLLETYTSRVRRATLDGFVDTVPVHGRYDIGGQDSNFRALAYHQDRVYVVDNANRRILVGMLTEDNGRLANLSVLKRVGDSGEKLTTGFVVEGAAPKPMLVRAVGPTLTHFGITSDYMPDPRLTLFDHTGTEVEANNDWVDGNDLVNTMQRLGAFALDSGSTDAALVRPIPNGPFTATIAPADGQAGQVLVEVYDTDLDAETRLTNLSTLTRVGPDDGRLIVGFVITGEAAKTVLVRGVGPSLTQFGLPANTVLRDPRIRLFTDSTFLAENDNWAGAPLLAAAFNAVGAFSLLDAETKDATLLIRLAPGTYSVHLESVDGHTGSAIAEVYEVK